MALSFSILKNQLMMRFSSVNNTPTEAANHIATSFELYIQGIQNIGSGSFVSMPGVSTLKSQLSDVFQQKLASKTAISNLITTHINNCYLTLQTAYQTGPPTTSFGFLKNKNQVLFNENQPSGFIFGQKLA